jgi:alpha/beta superfamily hydrolase
MSNLRDCQKPKLFIQGGEDEFGSGANVQAFFDILPEPKRLVVVEDTDHFFHGKLDNVAAAIDQWLTTEERLGG